LNLIQAAPVASGILVFALGLIAVLMRHNLLDRKDYRAALAEDRKEIRRERARANQAELQVIQLRAEIATLEYRVREMEAEITRLRVSI
jgi:predicted RNase H-like nuclease (RuvC/YqgF family)